MYQHYQPLWPHQGSFQNPPQSVMYGNAAIPIAPPPPPPASHPAHHFQPPPPQHYQCQPQQQQSQQPGIEKYSQQQSPRFVQEKNERNMKWKNGNVKFDGHQNHAAKGPASIFEAKREIARKEAVIVGLRAKIKFQQELIEVEKGNYEKVLQEKCAMDAEMKDQKQGIEKLKEKVENLRQKLDAALEELSEMNGKLGDNETGYEQTDHNTENKKQLREENVEIEMKDVGKDVKVGKTMRNKKNEKQIVKLESGNKKVCSLCASWKVMFESLKKKLAAERNKNKGLEKDLESLRAGARPKNK